MFATKVVQEYIAPVFLGDRLTRRTRFVSVEPERETRVGTGHFFTFANLFTNQKQELVSREEYSMLRYRPIEESRHDITRETE